MKNTYDIIPFDNCPALDGYHCQTNSLAKIFYHNKHPLSEDMLLGLGAGMGFIYWRMKMGSSDYVFIGGRGNTKEFFNDIGKRTGVKIEAKSTSSVKKAETLLLEKLSKKEPVMVYRDMGFLPWFDLPNLFSLYIFVEIGGTGGGCFRYMYSRFLEESTKITGNKELAKASEKIYESGKIFSEVGLLFKDAEKDPDIKEKIRRASEKFEKIADIEEEAFNCLSASIY